MRLRRGEMRYETLRPESGLKSRIISIYRLEFFSAFSFLFFFSLSFPFKIAPLFFLYLSTSAREICYIQRMSLISSCVLSFSLFSFLMSKSKWPPRCYLSFSFPFSQWYHMYVKCREHPNRTTPKITPEKMWFAFPMGV
ncbi:hypothetical protein F4778DRAFT_210388 [Xylariomycetidae sp. FL2044]|nr:hypothetical protein F4778DRAFT_210388 [Xylariomycetidae sp. FL2044]